MIKYILFTLKVLLMYFALNTGARPIEKIYSKIYKCSYYHDMFNGRKTALGNIFSNNGYTCATSEKEFLGKYIVFQSKATKRKLKLFCNDLMAKRMKGKVHFDLTRRAMKYLSGKEKQYPGHIEVYIASTI
jgi:hypothetical protein